MDEMEDWKEEMGSREKFDDDIRERFVFDKIDVLGSLEMRWFLIKLLSVLEPSIHHS